jgi:hypothetical protein
MTEPAERKVPPGEVAKIATAGATGVFVFGLAAVMGWAERPAGEPAVIPVQPATTLSAPTTVSVAPPGVLAPTTTTSLVPLATTVPASPVSAPVPVPAPPVVAAPEAPPPAPIVVVSEQSQ